MRWDQVSRYYEVRWNEIRQDEVITIKTDNAKIKARELASEHGLFVGISAAANVFRLKR